MPQPIFIQLNLDPRQPLDIETFYLWYRHRLGSKALLIFPDNYPDYLEPAYTLARGGLAKFMRPYPGSDNVKAAGIPTLSCQQDQALTLELIQDSFRLIDAKLAGDGGFDYIVVPYVAGKPAFGSGVAKPLPDEFMAEIKGFFGKLKTNATVVTEANASELASFSVKASPSEDGASAASERPAKRLRQDWDDAEREAVKSHLEIVYEAYMVWISEKFSTQADLQRTLDGVKRKLDDLRGYQVVPVAQQFGDVHVQPEQVVESGMPEIGDEALGFMFGLGSDAPPVEGSTNSACLAALLPQDLSRTWEFAEVAAPFPMPGPDARDAGSLPLNVFGSSRTFFEGDDGRDFHPEVLASLNGGAVSVNSDDSDDGVDEVPASATL